MHKTWRREADSAPLPRRARASACSARGLFFLLVAARVPGAPVSALVPCAYRYRGCVLSENICLGILVGHFFSLLILLLCVFEYFLLIFTAPRNLCACSLAPSLPERPGDGGSLGARPPSRLIFQATPGCIRSPSHVPRCRRDSGPDTRRSGTEGRVAFLPRLPGRRRFLPQAVRSKEVGLLVSPTAVGRWGLLPAAGAHSAVRLGRRAEEPCGRACGPEYWWRVGRAGAELGGLGV